MPKSFGQNKVFKRKKKRKYTTSRLLKLKTGEVKHNYINYTVSCIQQNNSDYLASQQTKHSVV